MWEITYLRLKPFRLIGLFFFSLVEDFVIPTDLHRQELNCVLHGSSQLMFLLSDILSIGMNTYYVFYSIFFIKLMLISKEMHEYSSIRLIFNAFACVTPIMLTIYAFLEPLRFRHVKT